MSEPIEIDLPPYESEPSPRYYNRDEPVTTNHLRIELSPDLDKNALVAYIRDAMDKAAAQMVDNYRFIPIREPAERQGEDEEDLEDTGHVGGDGRWYPSKSEIRAFIREEVHRALYPDAALANPHEHRRIEMTEESGKKWRGVLYAVDEGE